MYKYLKKKARKRKYEIQTAISHSCNQMNINYDHIYNQQCETDRYKDSKNRLP